MKCTPSRPFAFTRGGVLLLLVNLAAGTAATDQPGLGHQLMQEREYTAAAVEFRRAAGQSPDEELAGIWYWHAAYAYFRAQDWRRAGTMLDRADDAALDISAPVMLLRAETALAANQTTEAQFYLESLSRADPEGDLGRYARIRLARAALQEHPPQVSAAVAALPSDLEELAGLINRYPDAPRRTPRLGGWLGIIPGLGYAYSGEYANGLRSLILNALFIWGMVETAERDQWGAFSVITFFELTWFSGSIYGGIDAAHRFNRTQHQDRLDAIDRAAGFQPDWSALPTLTLQFRF